MDEFDIYKICIKNNINPDNIVNMEVLDNENGSASLRIQYIPESNLMPHMGHHNFTNINKTKKSYNPDFDFPENFKFPGFLTDVYWNKKIEKHGSIENVLQNIYNIGINPNIKKNEKKYISNLNNSNSHFPLIEDSINPDLEHKMRQMINIANSINLPKNCLTDKTHYNAILQSLNSIEPGDKSSLYSLERSLDELRKNWG